MNKKENKAFDECLKEIKRLIIKEKTIKRELDIIQNEKMNCIRILLDDEFCYEILKGEKNDRY